MCEEAYAQYKKGAVYTKMIIKCSVDMNKTLLKKYEDLINNQEGKSRDIIDFVGLEWDRSCLDFHTSESAVRTASKWQVREPIYKRSVGKWKVYEDYLSPSLIAFGQATFDRS